MVVMISLNNSNLFIIHNLSYISMFCVKLGTLKKVVTCSRKFSLCIQYIVFNKLL